MPAGTRIAIDVGGTFTDVVTLEGASQQLRFDKVPTTPADPQQGVMNGFAASGTPLSDVETFIHGTTLGLNALLTRRGARTGIITTKGFRDVYLLGRTDRVPMYDFKYRKPASLVERQHILEVAERLDFEGNVVVGFDDDSARAAASRVRELGLESVAISFLHSYVNPAHEQRMAEILREVAPGVEVTVCSALSRELREYERTSTGVLDAYIKPIVRRYLSKLETTIAERGFAGQFLTTRSGGGAMTVSTAKDAPVNLILSGPAGGVLGASWFAHAAGQPNLITIDMGGTSLDASLVVNGEPLTYHDAAFEGLPINLASLYIHTIGAGGGSLVWIDDGNHLQVGPASAGAEPGPAAYNRGGTQATFTDAALYVGYLGSDMALAGSLTLNRELRGRSPAGGRQRPWDVHRRRGARCPADLDHEDRWGSPRDHRGARTEPRRLRAPCLRWRRRPGRGRRGPRARDPNRDRAARPGCVLRVRHAHGQRAPRQLAHAHRSARPDRHRAGRVPPGRHACPG